MEHWKPVVGHEGLYEVSDLGRVKSLRRNGRILKPQRTQTGYLQVWLYNGEIHSTGRTGKNYQLHRIVAEAFLENPNGLPEVNHINEDKSDNRADNLEWCTHAYNSAYGTRGEKIGKKNKNGKRSIPIDQLDIDGNYIQTFPSWQEAARAGYHTGNIWKQIKGEYTHAYGYKWRYSTPSK